MKSDKPENVNLNLTNNLNIIILAEGSGALPEELKKKLKIDF